MKTDVTVWRRVRSTLEPVLHLAAADFLNDLTAAFDESGIAAAVAARETPVLFDWLIEMIQFQGVSDASAVTFADQNGLPRWRDLDLLFRDENRCGRLQSYWHFHGCGFSKTIRTCSEPDLLPSCPVAALPARNGRLSQAAVSLFFFMRDVCDGDFVSWVDHRLATVDEPGKPDRAHRMRTAVLESMTNIFGVSNKVLSMALADLLLAGDPDRERWVTTGASMIVVDSLVHNFLHRTGILSRLGADHAYGLTCYAPGHCATVIEELARGFDARNINPAFPGFFPRLVQHALWRFCAASEFDICNGNRIDDRRECRNRLCPTFDSCDRLPLVR